MVSPRVSLPVRTRSMRLAQTNRRLTAYLVFLAFIVIVVILGLIYQPLEAPGTAMPVVKKHHMPAAHEIDDLDSACDSAVDRLIELKIRLLALDFDETVVDIHTGGRWTRSAEDLVDHVRPEFKCLIQRSLERELYVAVTTFSKKEELISSVLKQAIPAARSNRIPVRGGENRRSNAGKKKQLFQVIQDVVDMASELDVPFSNEFALLVDDDEYNVQRARDDGYRSIVFDPEHPMLLFEHIKALH